jgi:queuosine precursor transporter
MNSPLLRNLPPIDPALLRRRRERVFLLLAGIFLGTLAMLNIIGITRFIHIGPLTLAVGVLPYPLTFLCTDFLSEFYGRRRANFVVLVGMILNIFVIGILWLGSALPAMDFKTDLQRLPVVKQETVLDAEGRPLMDPRNPALPLRRVVVETDEGTRAVESIRMAPVIDPETGEAILDPATGRPVTEPVDAASGEALVKEEELYGRIFASSRAAVLASMLAYLVAQFCDVWLFHFWKRLTKGKHLWLRNNGSTMVSQLVDTSAVVLITFWAAIRGGEMGLGTVMTMVWGAYLFKLAVAAVDTLPFYAGTRWLSRYLRIDPVTGEAERVEGLFEPGESRPG